MNRIDRIMTRAPIGIYRVGLGGLLGKRFLLLEHTGRKSGIARRTVLEVVEIGGTGDPAVVSGFGEGSDWCRNVTADPTVAFTLGRTRVPATAHRLDPTEAAAVLGRYAARHPRAARVIGRRIGVSLVDGLENAARRLPLFRLVADPPPAA